MPIFEYECKTCGYRGERIVSFDNRHSVLCPLCCTRAELLVSVPCVRMDTFIGGRLDPTFGYVTSKAELRKKEEKAGLRPAEAGDGASARLARADKSRKEDIVREKIIGETVRDVYI